MNFTATKLTRLVLAALPLLFVLPARSDDVDKLKQLESALKAPAAVSVPTKAIVFDPAPTAPTAPTATNATPVNAADATGGAACAALPTDAKGEAIPFSIQFKLGSAELQASSKPLLTQIASIIAKSPDHCILIEGHTDATGKKDSNTALSKARAESVSKFIAAQTGVDSAKLLAVGRGSSDPLPNVDKRDATNRRVVFKVITG